MIRYWLASGLKARLGADERLLLPEARYSVARMPSSNVCLGLKAVMANAPKKAPHRCGALSCFGLVWIPAFAGMTKTISHCHPD
jgi:hypothetical protein